MGPSGTPPAAQGDRVDIRRVRSGEAGFRALSGRDWWPTVVVRPNGPPAAAPRRRTEESRGSRAYAQASGRRRVRGHRSLYRSRPSGHGRPYALGDQRLPHRHHLRRAPRNGRRQRHGNPVVRKPLLSVGGCTTRRRRRRHRSGAPKVSPRLCPPVPDGMPAIGDSRHPSPRARDFGHGSVRGEPSPSSRSWWRWCGRRGGGTGAGWFCLVGAAGRVFQVRQGA
jgi:hypothetical protein